jgi:hypothetical protein
MGAAKNVTNRHEAGGHVLQSITHCDRMALPVAVS